MNYQYSYILVGIAFLIIWLALFIYRKNIRKEIFIMSFIFAFAGPLADILYTKDWWHPLTLTNTTIWIESFITGFMIGGVASVIYEAIFKKMLKIPKFSRNNENKKNINFIFILALSALIFFGSFYFLKFNSLISTILAFAIPTLIIWIKRRDLILDSIATGIILVVTASLVYTFINFLTPEWIDSFWYFKNTPKIIILNLPLDDIIWYFLAGLFIGPLYEYWKEGRLVSFREKTKIKKIKRKK